MRTLQELKDKYAESEGYYHWIDLIDCNCDLEYELDRHFNAVIDLAQRECRKQTLAYIDEKIKNTPAMGSNFSVHNNSDNFLLK